MLCWCCLPILAQLLIFFQNHFTNSSVRLFIYKISTHCFLKAAFLCFFFPQSIGFFIIVFSNSLRSVFQYLCAIVYLIILCHPTSLDSFPIITEEVWEEVKWLNKCQGALLLKLIDKLEL